MRRRKTLKRDCPSAHAHFVRGSKLEEKDAREAKAAYEACLAGDCRHLEARINLGRLMHLEGLLQEAKALYSEASEPSATLFFNLGVLLEDLGDCADAIGAYRQALAHDPAMADAHFNLSLLYERAGDGQGAFRHLLAYRRIIAINGSTH
jgi:tetratricopeptide (TPR) repeat protein